MTASADPQTYDWMDRDNALRRRWTSLGDVPVRQADPLARLLGFRTDEVRVAGEIARQSGRRLRVVRYVQTAEHEAGTHLAALSLVAQSRRWLVRGEPCLDMAGPALLEYRPGLSAARRLLHAGFADGLLRRRTSTSAPTSTSTSASSSRWPSVAGS
ncbi:hypothetical protein [Streptomyces sp. NPDC012746]|uniref:hypothetical protein n=1 Tax=Streptomyces sp. NPDC012746 TaxID=3364845 RepID=UPI0036866272